MLDTAAVLITDEGEACVGREDCVELAREMEDATISEVEDEVLVGARPNDTVELEATDV